MEYEKFKTYKGHTILVHPELLTACVQLTEFAVNDDDDALIIVGGKEGGGKTIHMYQIAHILATLTKTKFTPDNVHFDANAYMDWAETQSRGTVGVFDEARRTLNKARTLGQSQQDFLDWVSMSRDLNQIMIIGLPHPDDLVGYVVNERIEDRGFIIQQLKQYEPVTKMGRTISKTKRGHYYYYSADSYIEWKDENPKSRYKWPDPAIKKFDGYNGNVTGFTNAEMEQLIKKKKYFRNQHRMEKARLPFKYFYLLSTHLIESGMKKSEICKITGMIPSDFSKRYNAFKEYKDDSKEFDDDY